MSHVRIEHSSIYLLVFKIYVGDIPTSTVLLHHYPSTHPRSCKDISGLLLLFFLLLLYIYTHIGGFPIYGGTPLSLDGDLSNPHLSVLLSDRGHRWNHPKLRILLGVGMY